MKILNNIEQKSDEWHAWRGGIISSTDAKSLVGTKDLLVADLIKELVDNLGFEKKELPKKKEDLQKLIIEKNPSFEFTQFITKDNDTLYYKLLAHELSDGTAPQDERAMDRGNRLEPEIRDWFNKEYNEEFYEVGGCTRSDNDKIGLSPDGINKKDQGLEIKALAGWKHVKAWQENSIPDEHVPQCIQYFVVNDKMEKLYFVMGCPEIKVKPYLVFEVSREDFKKEIDISLKSQIQLIHKVKLKLVEINF